MPNDIAPCPICRTSPTLIGEGNARVVKCANAECGLFSISMWLADWQRLSEAAELARAVEAAQEWLRNGHRTYHIFARDDASITIESLEADGFTETFASDDAHGATLAAALIALAEKVNDA